MHLLGGGGGGGGGGCFTDDLQNSDATAVTIVYHNTIILTLVLALTQWYMYCKHLRRETTDMIGPPKH